MGWTHNSHIFYGRSIYTVFTTVFPPFALMEIRRVLFCPGWIFELSRDWSGFYDFWHNSNSGTSCDLPNPKTSIPIHPMHPMHPRTDGMDRIDVLGIRTHHRQKSLWYGLVTLTSLERMDIFWLFGYNRCEVRQIFIQKNFSKNFVAIWKKRNSGAHVLWGEYIARGDEYGKK